MIHQPLKDLYIVDLDQPRTGFHHFVSSWVYKRGNAAILIDPGPASTIPVLLEALTSLDVRGLDVIMITHIHIDHVGGLGLLLKQFPEARVLCHKGVVRHLIDPSKLWKGSQEILGSLAELYGPIEPTPESNIAPDYFIRADDMTIETVETPGHSSHHVCYRLDDILFIGEVAGVTYPTERGLYLRIASPARFVYEAYRQSIMKAADIDARHLCFAHYGYRKRRGSSLFAAARDQIDLWLEIVEAHLSSDDDEFFSAVFSEILKRDPSMELFATLPHDVRERERYFAANSIEGMRRYFEERG